MIINETIQEEHAIKCKPATWDSRLSGSYKGQCGNAWASFGKNGGDDNKMAVSLFVNTSDYHFQKTSTIFESISWAKTRTGN